VTEKRDNRWIPGEGRQRDAYPIAGNERNQQIPIDKVSGWLRDQVNRERLEDHLDWYLKTDNNYEGRQFEWFSSQAKSLRFTGLHVLAAESLSVKVPSAAARWLLEPDEDRNNLLHEVHQSLAPGANTLWTCDPALLTEDESDLKSSGALFQLYYCLRKAGKSGPKARGIGPVTTSKLLSAMFPTVVPIRDSMVEALLDFDVHENWWLTVRKLLEEDGQSLVRLLEGLRVPEGSEGLTTLRRLDIILWMEANARGLKPRSVRTTEYPGIEE